MQTLEIHLCFGTLFHVNQVYKIVYQTSIRSDYNSNPYGV